jgi:membrane protein
VEFELMTWTESDWMMRWRRRYGVVDLVAEILDGWRRHVTSRNAAVLTYYGFLSIFPLFMVATTILALVLRNNEQLQQDILDTAVAQIPVIGTQIEREAGQLDGNLVTLVIGLTITLWAATRAFAGIQLAFDDAWEVHIDKRDNLAINRLKGVLGIGIIGIGLISATAVSGFAAVAVLPFGGRVLLALATLVINTAVLGLMMKTLTAAEVSWSMVWPGALFGGFGFTVLQFAGTTIVRNFLANASDTAGAFAVVFALMAWLNLHAFLSLGGAELNGALYRRRERGPLPVRKTADANS